MTPLVNYQLKKKIYISKANFAVEKHRALNTYIIGRPSYRFG